MLPLHYYGDSVLRKISEPVEFNQEVADFIAQLKETLKHYRGGGLAAPQVGKLWRVFIVDPYDEEKEGHSGEIQCFINPQITSPSEDLEIHQEGCLSLPGIWLNILRPLAITVEALDENGVLFKRRVEGFQARQIMHENDHLNGVLTIDRLGKNERKKIEHELRKIKNTYHKKQEK